MQENIARHTTGERQTDRRCSGVGPCRSDQPGLTSEFGPGCHWGSTEGALTCGPEKARDILYR